MFSGGPAWRSRVQSFSRTESRKPSPVITLLRPWLSDYKRNPAEASRRNALALICTDNRDHLDANSAWPSAALALYHGPTRARREIRNGHAGIGSLLKDMAEVGVWRTRGETVAVAGERRHQVAALRKAWARMPALEGCAHTYTITRRGVLGVLMGLVLTCAADEGSRYECHHICACYFRSEAILWSRKSL